MRTKYINIEMHFIFIAVISNLKQKDMYPYCITARSPSHLFNQFVGSQIELSSSKGKTSLINVGAISLSR